MRVIKSRRMGCLGHIARMGEMRNVYSILVGKPEGKRPHGRPGRRWEGNIGQDLREMRLEVDWIRLAQERDQWQFLVKSVMNLRVP
jgi:hypothetical protein